MTTGGAAREVADLTGEEIEIRFPNEASDGVRYSNLRVLRSAAGYYIGRTSWELGFPFEQPYSRESGYFATEAEASAALLGGGFSRGCIENEVARAVGDLPQVSEVEGEVFEALVRSASEATVATYAANKDAVAAVPNAAPNAPQIISRKSLARGIARRWFNQYKREIETGNEQRYAHLKGQTKKQVYERLVGLGSDPDPNAVDAVIGNASWTFVHCSACQKSDVPFVIRVGEIGMWEPMANHEAHFVDLCTGCLHVAMVTMDDALAKHAEAATP